MNMKNAVLILIATMALGASAKEISLLPGEHTTVRGTTIYCQGDSDPNPKWGCACYVLNRYIGGVEVFATNRQKAEAAAMPLCQSRILPETQVVECERM
jgi:hypothetical protein